MNKKTLFTVLSLLYILALPCATAQTERDFETDPVILDRIDQWQDLKFGLMMHWGIYSQWGVVESWSICNEPWIDRKGADYTEYKAAYQNLNKTFNPVKFDPDSWAALAKEAGMKYFVFTTKHHDGFCMFDTKETDYSVTGKECPFSTNPKADITGELVNSFRKQGLWTGLYFSKPDWHCDDYWAHEWATPDRNVNYDPEKHPERWEKYCDFTRKQLAEITHNYGDIDILWLDGGWVRPEWSVDEEVRDWLGCQGWIQDIDMKRVADNARAGNPDLIIVDRSVHGKYENYRTPEQEVPDTLLPYPWETCMSMGDSWSYVATDNYKSSHRLVHLLADIVAKGGNFLLNVGPSPEGELPKEAVERLHDMGQWLKTNGKAIYGTRPLYPYSCKNIRFTQSKTGESYAIILLPEEGESSSTTFSFSGIKNNVKKSKLQILGFKEKATLTKKGGEYFVTVPNNVIKNAKYAIVVVF
ncbi:MAG: alpha-L-fucosidase [Bacteroidales bacterium]|nr:alpha-L-fucosidase [Bacteroidales bacterium]MDY6348299.1 alpha-L-fucosidase [Bacteroidales bacterium]